MNDKHTVGELFAGIGGIGLGLERTGCFEVKWQVECDKYANKVLAKNWPDVRRHDDVCTFPPKGNWKVDVVAGGFPCQDISFAGKGAGLDGQQSGLFYEGIRIIDTLRPRWVLLENVTALLVRGLGDVLRALDTCGYNAEWQCLSAAASVGAPHIRDRIFIIGTLADTNHARNRTPKRHIDQDGSAIVKRREKQPQPKPSGYGGDVPDTLRTGLERHGAVAKTSKIQTQGAVAMHGGGKRKTAWSTECRLGVHPNGVSTGLDGSECGGWECGIDRLTTNQVDRNARLRCLGNAVVPQVAQFVGELLLQRIQEQQTL